MKKTFILIVAIVSCALLSFSVLAHSGRTDSNGGHNSSTGYHYHHGYPAHQHTNGECPYDFDDKTNRGSSQTKSTSSGSKSKNNKKGGASALISHDDFITFIGGLICIFGCIYCPFWIKKAENAKDRFYGIFSLIGSLIMLILLIWLRTA